MAYLKLNSSKIRRIKRKNQDFVILSQIINSQSSYEYPKKVNSEDELIKWFGNSYSDFNYHIELLRSGATLYLYKPISIKKRKDIESYIDYSNFKIETNIIYDDPSQIPYPEDKIIYNVLDNRYVIKDGSIEEYTGEGNYLQSIYYDSMDSIVIPETSRHNTVFQVSSDSSAGVDQFIWNEDSNEYINVNFLPQNLGVADTSTSWNNRDTIALMPPTSGKSIYVSHPRYSDIDDIELPDLDPEKVKQKYSEKLIEFKKSWCYAFDLNFDNALFDEDSYITYRVGPTSTLKLIYFSRSSFSLPSSDIVSIENRVLVDINGLEKEEIVEKIWKALVSEEDLFRYENTLWSNYPMPIEYFYKLPGFSETPNYRFSDDIISKSCDDYRILFTSKTIGKHDLDLNIKIEKISNNNQTYRITISRDGYGEEIHTGSLYKNLNSSDNDDYIEYVINRDSELVRVKINHYQNKSTIWKQLNPQGHIIDPRDDNFVYYNTNDGQYYRGSTVLPNPDLPVGSWKMRGSVSEDSPSYSEYFYGLDSMKESDMSEDFLMIPKISDYRTPISLRDLSWYPEYSLIYEYCTTKNCQALISNNDIGEEVEELPENPRTNWIYKIDDKYMEWSGSEWIEKTDRESCNPYLNEFIWNFVQTTDDLENPVDFDRDNFLVYFYRNIYLPQTYEERPGYYIFVRNILTNSFNLKASDILYRSPVKDPIDFSEIVDLIKFLEHKKSNYLVRDINGYYYRKYFNHTGDELYNISILTKFLQSKLSREFNNNKWELINTRPISKLLENINGILYRFSSNFSLVSSVELINYNIDYSTSSASFEISLRTYELVDKDINLNIILNYIY